MSGTPLHVQELLTAGWTRISTPYVPAELVERCYANWNSFFIRQYKDKFQAGAGELDGYFPFNSEKAIGADSPDPKEFFHWYKNGKTPALCTASTTELFDQLSSVAVALLVELSKEMPELRTFASDIGTSERLVLRIAHYMSDGSANLFNAPHEDIDFLTVLPMATAPGLEVLEGGTWKSAVAGAGECLVLTGDMLAEATAGKIKAVKHRVVAAARERLSIQFFTNPDDNVQLSPQWRAGDLLMYRLRHVGLAA